MWVNAPPSVPTLSWTVSDATNHLPLGSELHWVPRTRASYAGEQASPTAPGGCCHVKDRS